MVAGDVEAHEEVAVVRLNEVAQLAGVSTATASLVLSGKAAGRASSETSERVRQAADELGYVGNAAAMSLRTQRTSTVGFISDHIATTPYAVRMVAVANRVAMDAGYLLILLNTDGEPRHERVAVAELRRHGVQRVVYASMYHREVVPPADLPAHLVLLDAYSTDPTIPAIVPDEEQGVRDALGELLRAGHRRIAYLGESSTVGAAAELRRRAFLDVMAREGIDVPPEFIVECPGSDVHETDAAARELLAGAQPTAVFCFNDNRAASVYRAASHRGLSVPQDLSIVGFDNLELIAERLDPPLTTVSLPHDEMAEWAVWQVLEAGGEPPPGGYPVRQSCRLQLRGSVGPPRD